jgi:hypothetical protein
MANYIINDCLTNEQYVVSADTELLEGQVIGYSVDEIGFCATVGVGTVDPLSVEVTLGITYTDCCDCLSATTADLNFKFIRCGTLEEINISPTFFCSEYGAPTSGMTYEIRFDTQTPFCATFSGLSESGETNYSYVSGPFLVCEDCGEEPPRSAGTEVTICQETCDVSGTTVTTFIPPHPEWTDGYGTQVTQLNMIALGGPNGLNN